MIKYLHECGWVADVLTVHGKYFYRENEGDEKTLKQIPESATIIRTKCFFVERFFGNLSANIVRKQGKVSNEITVPNTDAEEVKPLNGQRTTSSKYRIQRFKDFITNLFSIPDKYIGWIPFAVWAGVRSLRERPADVIYAVGKPWTGFFVGYILKVLFRKPLVIDFMDPWKASTWRPSKGSILESIQTYLERFIVTHADFVIANTNELSQDFVKRLNIPQERVDVLTCGYDEADLYDDYQEKSSNKFTITHTGSFYKKRNPINFLKAIKALVEKNLIPPDRIAVNFVGAMAVKDPELNQLLADPLFKKVVNQESWVPHKKALEYLYQSDVLLLVQPETYLQIPAKLYEYIAVQKPIIALAEEKGAVGNIVRNEGWGEAINNENIDKIGEAIYQYYQEYENGKLNPETTKYNIEAYSVKSIAAKLGKIFQKILNKKDMVYGHKKSNDYFWDSTGSN